ncbi:hypothetical protein Y1Q_0008789 [Alligator mississippiensis]|uniref:Uncharacterized protein n=1 Tax=Alligator mississippiensis TaxID=8496 RepID=A0A151NA03_ALLMI|nr:hypothetical protein Y1Q_0008789 [Alligator mississippiensis]
MHQLHRRTQDLTLLLDKLVMAAEDQQVDKWMWQAEDVACEDAWEWADQELRAQLLALECEYMEALQQQGTVMAKAVQAMEEDCQGLDTILAVTFMPLASLPMTRALPAPWQLPTTQQAPLWAWREVQHPLH